MLMSGAYGYLSDYVLFWLLLISLFIHTWFFFKLFPREHYRKSGIVLGNVLVCFCMLGVVALAVETHIRFTVIETDSFGVSLPARRWFALNTKLNSLGCRDEEWSLDKHEGVRRIAFVGDSFTYGWGIERVEDRFTDIIQARFDERAHGAVEVFNVAKAGWGTADELQPILDLITRYGVDEIVLCYVPNDIEKLIPTTESFDPTMPPDSVFFNLDTSCLLDWLYRRLYLPRLPTVRGYHDWLAEGYASEDVWRTHQQQLYDIKRTCDEHRTTLHVALFPFVRTSGEKFQSDTLHALLGRFFQTNGIEYVDLLPTIQGMPAIDLVVNTADAHPNERAHRLFADALWKALYAGG